MKFEKNLHSGVILKRYKRFLCDIVLDNTSEKVTAHCPNSGSMKGIPLSDAKVMLSYNPSPTRKYPYTLEMIHDGNVWIGVNTSLTNAIAEEGIRSGFISSLNPFDELKREVKYGKSSRIDIFLTQNNKNCYVEVKNVTLTEGRFAIFPDSVTTRGQKHLDELTYMVKQGHRSVMLYIIQRTDCEKFRPAYEIDQVYADKFKAALSQGVEAYAYKVNVTPEEITFVEPVQIDF